MFLISLIEYLNSAPLGWAFLHGPLKDCVEVVLSTPSRCAEQLAAGSVDVGLIPSIEYQRIPGLRIVPGIAIASTGPVRSVILVRRHGREVRSVALDTSSRTSAGLVQILLPRRFGITPEYVHHAPDVDAMLRMCDAAQLIGDRALQVSPSLF